MSESHHAPSFDGLSSLISFAGFSIPARARFVAQFVGSTLFSSVTVGLVAGQTGALLSCGPLIPFIAGSWIGYTWGCVGFWRRARLKALTCARRYPRVLAHGLLIELDIEVPRHLRLKRRAPGESNKEAKVGEKKDVSLEEWILAGGIGRLSYAMLAAQGCDEDIAEMQKGERQKLIDGYSQKD